MSWLAGRDVSKVSPGPSLSRDLSARGAWSRLSRLHGPIGFLVAALSGLAAVSWIFAPQVTRSGLLINLATEVLGIGITVFVVDQLLDMHERDRWFGLDAHIGAHLRNAARIHILAIRSGLDINPNDLIAGLDVLDDESGWERGYFTAVARLVEPQISSAAESLDGTLWTEVMTAVQAVPADFDRLIAKFLHRLSPDTQKAMLEIQDLARQTLAPYEIAPMYFRVGTFKWTPKHEIQAAALRARSTESLADLVRRLRELGESTFEDR